MEEEEEVLVTQTPKKPTFTPTQQQKPIASEMTLTIPLDNNQTTTKTIQTN